MAKMLKKLFILLSAFCVVSLGGYVVVLLLNIYNTNGNFAVFIPLSGDVIKDSITSQIEQKEEPGIGETGAKEENNKSNKKEDENLQLKKENAEEQGEKQEKPEKSGGKQEKAEKPETQQEICPELPPGLVGALDVNYNVRHTLDDALKIAGQQLSEGGRYTPKECVARQKVAIIIPFRNRHEHLSHWLYYLHPILMRQQLDYGVFVINQDGDGIFNRAKLMNVGYVEAMKQYDYNCLLFSDVDLVPMNDRNFYRCFEMPRHLAVAMDKFNFHLPYETYFGGVSSLSKDQYLKINGFSNTFWGWGGEDDDIHNRIKHRGMYISRPDSMTGRYKMIKHNRDLHNEPNPVNPDKLSRTSLTMNMDGINTLKYTVKKIEKNLLYTFITVDIQAPI
ncbi:beta-1,4-galactosyltransferase 1-like [Genypterus blacodes]|uniref:beta-1,4-galactosyltransferase 1-like n=1 Tax=Genypterus blacodes TaxID=154954 RepID=UPI003F76DE18